MSRVNILRKLWKSADVSSLQSSRVSASVCPFGGQSPPFRHTMTHPYVYMYVYVYNPGCNFLYRIEGAGPRKSFDSVEKTCTSILLQNQKPSNTIGQQVPKNPPFWDAFPKVPDSGMTLHEGVSIFFASGRKLI